MEGWSKERLRLVTVVSDCIDALKDELEGATGQHAELIIKTVQRLEQGLEIIRWEVAHPFLNRDCVPLLRIRH